MTDFFEEWKPQKTKSVKKDKAGNPIEIEAGFRVHHDNPLKPSYEVKRGLNDIGIAALEKDFAEEGIAFGNVIENFDVIPHDIHLGNYSKTVHKVVERRTGGKSLEALIERFKKEGKLPDKPWHEMELWEREPVINELKAGILEGRQLLTDFYNVVAALNPNNDASFKTIMNAVDKLDAADLEALAYNMVGRTEMSEWTLDWIKTVLGEGELVMKTFRGKTKLTWVSEPTSKQRGKDLVNSFIEKDLTNLIEVSKEDRAWEMLSDATGITVKNGKVVLKKPLTSKQIKAKHYPKVPKEESDIRMKQLTLAIDELNDNPKIKEDFKQLMLEFRSRRGGIQGVHTPSDKGQD